ncbi:MAG TPA: EamA family transporter [Bacilli bacterium]|nr:EamA family transporter [Bacilli bacterium]
MNFFQKHSAYLAALSYAAIIGFAFLFVKLTLAVTCPIDTLAHRFTASFVIASIPVLFGWIKIKLTLKDIFRILPLSLLYPAGFFSLQVFGLVYTTTSEAGIISATAPIFTMILATYILKEHSNHWQKLSIILSVSGVIYIFWMMESSTGSTSFIGVFLVLLSSLSVAGYNVLARPLTQKYRVIDITYMMTAIGFLFFNLIALVRHSIEGTLHTYFQPFTNLTFLLSILYLGVLSSLLTSFLSNYALSKMEASKMSVFSNLATLITIIAGAVFLNETLAYYHIIGAMMIITGIIGTNTFGEKAKKIESTS